jgi:tRNA pseudouridine38-40 synthase
MDGESPARRLALLLEYQGTAYGGSQYQENAPTVQGTLERALGKLTNESIRVAMAGRTDAGVHARGQVAAFNTHSRHHAETFGRGTNALLPDDIVVRAVEEVPLRFDPRRHANRRWYRYKLYLGRERPALLRHFVWRPRSEPDPKVMAKLGKMLEGRHDFAAFTPPSEAKRSVTEREVFRTALSQDRQIVTFDIEANAFLQHMVRRIVGTLVEAGTGRLQPQEFERMLREAPHGAASWTAPARGLTLMKVRYESGLFDDEDD